MEKSALYRQAYAKASKYCALQDRCCSEVLQRLSEFSLSQDEEQMLMEELQQHSFIDEQRYTQNYVRGKFRQKKWGKIKIRYQLRAKQISDALITEALQQIDEQDYEQVIFELLEKKYQSLQGKEPAQIKFRLFNYAQSKGYESFIIYPIVDNLMNKE